MTVMAVSELGGHHAHRLLRATAPPSYAVVFVDDEWTTLSPCRGEILMKWTFENSRFPHHFGELFTPRSQRTRRKILADRELDTEDYSVRVRGGGG